MLDVKIITNDVIRDEKLEPVTSPLIFKTKKDIDPDGIFSERIFGEIGTFKRRKKFAYIDLHTYIIHPIILTVFIKRLDRKVYDMVLMSKLFDYDEKEGKLIESESGELYGIQGFIKLFKHYQYKFKSNGLEKREKLIQRLNELNEKIFLNRLYVLPAGLRELVLDRKTGKPMFLDPINDFYMRIISLANKIKQETDKYMFNLHTINLQKMVNEYFTVAQSKVAKKTGKIRAAALGKRIDFSGRGVISGDPTIPPHIIKVPIYMIIQLYLPYFLHVLLKKKIPDNLYNKVKSFIVPKYGKELNSDSIKAYASAVSKFYIKDKDELETLVLVFNEFILKDKAVIFKRDPAVHRQSVRGQIPVAHIGHGIHIAPTITGGYGADFDGDSVICDVSLEIINKSLNKTIMLESNILNLNEIELDVI